MLVLHPKKVQDASDEATSTVSATSSAYTSSSRGFKLNHTKENVWKDALARALGQREMRIVELAARRLQAALRAKIARQKFRRMKHIQSVVTGSYLLHTEKSRRAVAVYEITVVRAGCCWQVCHRFSDWLHLNRALQQHFLDPRLLPAPPVRLPFGGRLVRSHRQLALNAYLQKLLEIGLLQPVARGIILSFLCRSHMFWAYPEQSHRTLRNSVLYDRSTGSTPMAAVVDSTPSRAPSSVIGDHGITPRSLLLPWQQRGTDS